MDVNQGLLCGLTNAKADFDGTCDTYDEDAVEKQKKEAEQAVRKENSKRYSGFAQLYLCCVGAGAVLTMILGWINFKTSFNLGNVWFLTVDVIWVLSFVALSIYTVIAFLRMMPNAVGLGKLQLYLVLFTDVLNIVTYYSKTDDVSYWNSPARCIGNMLWVTAFLVYLYMSEELYQKFPKQSRHFLKTDKILIASVLVALLCLFSLGIVKVFVDTHSDKGQMETAVAEITKVLPQRNEYGILSDVYLTDDTCFVVVKSTQINRTDYSSAQIKLAEIMAKENVLHSSSGDYNNPIALLCSEHHYYYTEIWNDIHNVYIYQISLSPSEYDSLSSKSYSYKTSQAVFEKAVFNYNRELPAQFISEDFTLDRVVRHDDSDTIIYNMRLSNVNKSELDVIEADGLKNYVLDNWQYTQDNMMIISEWNHLSILFCFTSDVSPTWKRSFVISSDEYKQ